MRLSRRPGRSVDLPPEYANLMPKILKNEEDRVEQSVYLMRIKLGLSTKLMNEIFVSFNIPRRLKLTRKVCLLQPQLPGMQAIVNRQFFDGIYGPITHRRVLAALKTKNPALYQKLINITGDLVTPVSGGEGQSPTVTASRPPRRGVQPLGPVITGSSGAPRSEVLRQGRFPEQNFDNMRNNDFEDVRGYEGQMRVERIKVKGGTIIACLPASVPPGKIVHMIGYFPGMGNQLAKFPNLNRGWHRRKMLLILRKMALKHGKYTALVFFQGNKKWPKFEWMYKRGKYEKVMKLARERLGIAANPAKYAMFFHSHGFRGTGRLLQQYIRPNLNSLVGSLDSVYGLGNERGRNTYWDDWRDIMTNNPGTRFSFLSCTRYRSNNDPLKNSRRMQRWFNNNPSNRSSANTRFLVTRRLDHYQVKSIGVAYMMGRYFGLV